MHCLVIRPVRLRTRRYLKLKSNKVRASVKSAFRGLGTLFRSSANNTNQRTNRSLMGGGADGRTVARDDTHAADSLEGSIIGPFEDGGTRDAIDMVLDCILDDHPELDGVLVDSLFQFDERMIGSEAVSFRRDVLTVETQSTPTGRFGIVKLNIIDCQSCGTKCYGRVELIQHVAGCLAHQQLVERTKRECTKQAPQESRVLRMAQRKQRQEMERIHKM
ncbi:hypothetical protein BKA62DRAFT_305273 [Auriculariales sp. MPI-PUGE-AT-0066]|nr:hypothetical protein BKA62DRAFT_305273 [Auriculariales sp. MPI-PUGE-AT-0066]